LQRGKTKLEREDQQRAVLSFAVNGCLHAWPIYSNPDRNAYLTSALSFGPAGTLGHGGLAQYAEHNSVNTHPYLYKPWRYWRRDHGWLHPRVKLHDIA
jgi:hypothetical protein